MTTEYSSVICRRSDADTRDRSGSITGRRGAAAGGLAVPRSLQPASAANMMQATKTADPIPWHLNLPGRVEYRRQCNAGRSNCKIHFREFADPAVWMRSSARAGSGDPAYSVDPPVRLL